MKVCNSIHIGLQHSIGGVIWHLGGGIRSYPWPIRNTVEGVKTISVSNLSVYKLLLDWWNLKCISLAIERGISTHQNMSLFGLCM